MVLEDVTEFDYSSAPTKLSKVLLNGNNICMVGRDKWVEVKWLETDIVLAYSRRRRSTNGGVTA